MDGKETAPETDWERLKTQKDEDIARAVADDLDTFIPDDEFWENAKVVSPVKQMITMRVDKDVLAFFKGKNPKGYQQRINNVLRSFVQNNAH